MAHYDKEQVKELLTLDQIFQLLEYFEAEPIMNDNYIVCRTICHSGDSHKLYYYENTSLFKCFTDSCGVFDVFELVRKVQDIELDDAVFFVVHYFNLQYELGTVDMSSNFEDWKIFKRRRRHQEKKENHKVILPEIENYIQYYPQPTIVPWEEEGINKDVADYMGIRYNPENGSILIPHYDEDNRLVGIRQRTLVQEEEKWGKYRPAYFKGKLCNHPLAFNLYGLPQAKEGIKGMRTAIVVESEKSVLEYISFFGLKNDMCVATCGSSLSNYQFHLLLDAGAKEVVIAYDRDYRAVGTKEYFATVEKIEKLCRKYQGFCTMSYLLDKKKLLGYKCSPTDCGKDAFLTLWRNRIII